MTTATYACTALNGTNKAGILKPDENGYYRMVLGALDIYNSAGAFWPFETAKHIFKESSSLMRRIASGALRGENGHPKKQPGMSMRDYIQRIMEIHEENVICHIKEVTVDYTSVKDENGRPVIAIIGKVKPSGPMGHCLKESLDNPDENVCFSIRSLTHDAMVNGKLHKNLKTVITWDYVNEPGLAVAKKWNSPSLESMDEEIMVTAQHLGSIRDYQHASGVSLENGETVNIDEIMQDLGWSNESIEESLSPPSAKW